MIIIDKIVTKAFKSAQSVDSNCSNASLANSVNSRLTQSLDSEETQRQINSWHEFVIQARNSNCIENFYTIQPLPPVVPTAVNVTGQRAKSERFPSPRIFKHRKNIRDVMRRAKNEFPAKSIQLNSPLPKNIPNQIFDDVQLFEFFYQNLNSVNFTERGSQDIKREQGEDNKSDNTMHRMEKLLSNHEISTVLSGGKKSS